MKICFKCKKEKRIEDFYKHSQMPDGHVNKCRECNKKDVRDNYALKVDEKRKYDTYRNRYSISRILNHRYSGIKDRCTNLERHLSHGYSAYGKKFLTKNEWLGWCYEENSYKKFIALYNKWVQSGFNEKLSPSIDRINNKLGYEKENLQWLTKSENSSKYIK